MSFNQALRFKRIKDPTMCFWDPSSEMLDKSDGDFAGRRYVMSKKKFKSKYPGIKIDNTNSFSDNSGAMTWMTEDDIMIADYYEKQYYKRDVSLLSDGTVVDTDDAENIIRKFNKKQQLLEVQASQQGIPFFQKELSVLKQELHDDFKVKFYRAISSEIIEMANWDSKVLPVIYQAGVVQEVDGREKTISFIRWIKDAQRSYNYSRSELAYRQKLTRYEPYMGHVKCIEGLQKYWKEAHKAKSYLPFKTGPNGEIPQRQSAPQIPQILIAEMQQSLQDIQNIPGRFEANLGANGNETSGVAILNRQKPGNYSVKPFFENANDAIESGINVVVDLLPKIFDTKRKVSIVDENNNEKNETINNTEDESSNITIGRFKATVTVGSSFAAQRVEAVEQFIRMVQVWPELRAVTPDLAVENLDLKNVPQLISRIRKWVMPKIAADETKDPVIIAELQQQEQKQEQEQKMILMFKQFEEQTKRITAMANQMSSQAKIMDSQTNRLEAGVKGVVESKKIQAEENRTDSEQEIAAFHAAHELVKGQQDNLRGNQNA
jgi:hypothetical protein